MTVAQTQAPRVPRYWLIAPVESKPPELFDKVWQFDVAYQPNLDRLERPWGRVQHEPRGTFRNRCVHLPRQTG